MLDCCLRLCHYFASPYKYLVAIKRDQDNKLAKRIQKYILFIYCHNESTQTFTIKAHAFTAYLLQLLPIPVKLTLLKHSKVIRLSHVVYITISIDNR